MVRSFVIFTMRLLGGLAARRLSGGQAAAESPSRTTSYTTLAFARAVGALAVAHACRGGWGRGGALPPPSNPSPPPRIVRPKLGYMPQFRGSSHDSGTHGCCPNGQDALGAVLPGQHLGRPNSALLG